MDDRVEQLLSGQYFKKYQEAMYSEITDKFNMTLMEVRVLLFFDNHGSSNTAKDLVRIFHYTKSNVSKAIDSLLLRGYLKKQYDDQDRRYIHLTVQPEAADVLEMARQLPQLRQVYLCLDNDAAGHAASERMATLLKEHGLNAVRLVPQQKDWNDDLKEEQENKMERSELCQTFC